MEHHHRSVCQFYRLFTGPQASATLRGVSFGQTVRRRREALSMTLEDLAERSGLSPNYVGSVENGRRDPSLSTVLALAKGLKSTPGDLVGGAKDLSPEAFEAGRLFDGVSSEIQDVVLRLLRAVSRRRR
jgi:transcriptional regulator with XRE-family HTH domain